MAVKVGMVSLGCSKNQVDAEIMLAKLQKAGFQLCTDSGLCDVVIVNTCGFIEDAKKESIENILEFATLKKEGRIRCIVVTGCLAERYQMEMAEEIPEADVILGIGSNDQIVEAIRQALEKKEKVRRFGPKTDLPLNGDRIISNLPFYAYLKIAEGCDNRCSYCAIPSIRGGYRSREMGDILDEARKLAEGSVKELVLVAQDTTRYGIDLYGEYRLPQLLEALCALPFRWIRVLYLYPDKITDQLLEVMNRQEKIVSYLDIPIQHCSAPVLRRMNRKGNRQELLALIRRIREKVENVILRTTLIAGFPGESSDEFEELMEFVKEAKFERLGCFAFSPEEGTPAAGMADQVEEQVKRHRCDIIMEEQMGIAEAFNQSLVGKTLEVVCEGYDRYAGSYFGRSRYDAPDIDSKVFFSSKKKLRPGEFVPVLIEDQMGYDLIGSVSGEGFQPSESMGPMGVEVELRKDGEGRRK